MALASKAGTRGVVIGSATMLVVLVSLWLSLIHHLAEKRRDDVAQAHRDVTNISVALAEQVSRMIAGVDQITRLMQDDFKRDPVKFDLLAWTKSPSAFDGIAKAVNVFDERGALIASTLPRKPGLATPSIADRSEFKRLSTESFDGLLFARTYPGRVSAGMVMPLLRRLEDGTGRFRGVMSVSLDPDYLTRQFASLDVGPDGSLALFGLDGFVRARTPFVPGMYDRSVAELASRKVPFADLLRSTSATYRLDSAFDGKIRIFGYRLVSGLPLFLTVGRSEAEVLAPFHHEALLVLTFGAIASATILSLFLLMLVEAYRRGARERALAAAHAALAKAEAGFRGVFESSPDVMYVHRIASDGTILIERFNPAAASIAGIDDSALERPLSEILPASVFADAKRAVDHVVATGEILRLQGDSSPDGADREIVILPLRSEDPSLPVDRVFVSVRDIRHLRLANEAIARSEARHRMLAETTSDVVTRLTLPDFIREYVSPACRALFGYEPEEMVGKVPSDDMHPDDRVEWRSRVSRFATGLEEDPRLTVTYRARHRDGHWIWLETCMSLARDDGGDPEALVCSLRDVSERRHADLARIASETRFKLLAENTGELILLAHDDGRRSYISPAANRLLGFTADELDEEMRSKRWLHPDDAAILAGTGLGDTGEASFSCRVSRKDGCWIWIEAIVRRIAHAGEGEPTIIASLRDVSERHAQADALRQARDAAEEASRAKTDFLATMSHEIRTPLNGILGFSELLLARNDLPAESRLQLDRIQNAGSALRTVVDDILDFSKLEAGMIDLHIAPFRPGALVDNATSIVRGLAQGKGIDLIVAIDSVVPTFIAGDHDRLRQVLLNLLNNAIKFTRTGTVILSLRCTTTADDRVRLRFSVTDTGIGIPEAKRSRLFQRFSQVDGSISREFGGSGLGLAICRSLVEAMGGRIGVESAEGKGSEFWFEVDLPKASASAGPSPIAAIDLADRVPSVFVLLVEDQELNQELARAIIEAAGHRVDVVGDGAAAVAAVSRTRYDLVLMDVQMPIMDGIEATKRIRGFGGEEGRIPIIAMTANVMPEQVERFMRAGMDGHLGKPFKKNDLLKAIIDHRQSPVGDDESDAPQVVFDAAMFDAMAETIGEVRATRLLDRAIAQASSLTELPMDARLLASGAHAALAATGSLGLLELTNLLRRLEHGCAVGDVADPLVAALGRGVARASAVVDARTRKVA